MNTPDESKSQDRALTATSYGVLSILALRDHSTYDLTRQMRISLHYLWPRAESNVYAEPKRLVQAGLAAAREQWTGSRRRTVYSITEAGRAALANWLAAPSSRARYESEALLKLLFAENGTTADMLAAIKAIREDATDVVTHFVGFADRYDAGAGEYPERFALSGLAARLLIEQAVAAIHWSEWAKRAVSEWTTPTAKDAAWGIAALRAAAQEVERIK